MSNLHLVTFADIRYEQPRYNTLAQCSKYFDAIKSYTPEDLDQGFIQDNIEILSRTYRGFGYWLWKPYIILDYLNNHLDDDNDIMLYVDAGDTFDERIINSVRDHLDDNLIYAIHGPHSNTQWTKRDCFVLMDCDNTKYWDTGYQIYSSMIACRKNQTTLDFFNEWFKFCKNKNILTDDENICGKPNFPDFEEHRHDQSIFHNLMTKYDVKTVKMGTPHFWTPDDNIL
jgi:hypothetical protein